MKPRLFRRLKRIVIPGSLRSQLLSRSLFLLAALLLLIGVFQYVLMKKFIYENKASSMRSQIFAVSEGAWNFLRKRPLLDGAPRDTAEREAQQREAAPGSGAGAPAQRSQGSHDAEAGSASQREQQAPGSGADAPAQRSQGSRDAGSASQREQQAPGGGQQQRDREFQDRDRPILFLPDTSIAFVDMNGTFAGLSDWPGGRMPPQLPAESYTAIMKKRPDRNGYQLIRDPEGNEQLIVMQPIFQGRSQTGLVQLGVHTAPLKDILFRQLLIYAVLSFTALLFGLLTFLPVLRRTLVPLSNMVHTVERIDSGNLDERLPAEQGQLEIDRLAESFNGMLKRLEISFQTEKEAKEQMRRFIADASHELRTPLTSLHGFLEVLLRGAAHNPEQLRKALTSMRAESERINKLVEDLLLLAKLDRTPHIELTQGALDAVIHEMELQLRVMAGNRTVLFHIIPDMLCLFDKDKMKQVILNLFHNAVQHTDLDVGKIDIVLQPAANGIELTVKDNGVGMADKHLPHIFDRFYRSDSSRTRKYGGSGLGLSITKSIVDIHRGTIRAECKEGSGCSFTIWLPGVS